jgi:hypothetical protein
MATLSEAVPACRNSSAPGLLATFVDRVRMVFGRRPQAVSYAEGPFIGL